MKSPNPTDTLPAPYVALFTRAWIEISTGYTDFAAEGVVALFTRAWIEIINGVSSFIEKIVALFTRAWIEMAFNMDKVEFLGSPSSRGRGLK